MMDFDMRQSSSPPRPYNNNNTNNHISLNTPIKKINQLSLNSPFQSPSSPILNSSPNYPALDDILIKATASEVVHDNVGSIMTNRGYSQKLTNNVLMELSLRANQLSSTMKSPPSTTSTNSMINSAKLSSNRKKKRYSGIHRGLYNGMESISNHYSVKPPPTNPTISNQHGGQAVANTTTNKTSPVKQDSEANIDQESSVKRRRTLNGPDEMLRYIPTFKLAPPEPTSSAQQQQSQQEKFIHKPNSLKMTSTAIPTLTSTSNPHTDTSTKSSPLRKISPSKKFMNLNALLTGDEEPSETDMLNGSPNKDKFLKPFPPSNKLRPSSLELAGVGNVGHSLTKKSSIPQLQKKPSIPNVNTSKNNMINPLTKKPSIPQLQRKSSIPQLQKKPSIPQLQSKPSIPQLQKKPSVSNIQQQQQQQQQQQHHQQQQQQQQHNALSPSTRSYSNRSISSVSTSHNDKILSKSSKINQPSSTSSFYKTNHNNSKITIPQPFSLYDKPTISSSQKSLQDNKSTFASSQKSLSKFARFKQQFQ